MADGLALLFQLKAQNQASPAIKAVQGDVARLRGQFGSDFKQMQTASTQSLAAITQSLTQVSGQIPIVGNAVSGLSSQMATLTATAGSTAGVVGIVAAGMIATAAAAVALGQSLFGAAESTAEFQGKMFDLSQQTGVAVETLSTLEVLAATTGGSIESIAQSLVIFQGKLEEAQDSSSKTAKQFKALGVETNNTEEAFRQALTALSKLPEGFHQTNEAAELFGRRGGKQVLAILKESHGDIDGVTKKLREMNILITAADAKLADEFSDDLRIFNLQLRALGAIIGKEVMPVALKAIQDLSKALNENRQAVSDLARVAGVLSVLFTGPLRGAIGVVEAAMWALHPAIRGVAELYDKARAAAQLFTLSIPTVDANGIPSLGTGPSVSALPVESGADVGVGGGFRRKKRTGSGRGGGSKDTGASDAKRELEQQADAWKELTRELALALDVFEGIDTESKEYAVTQSILNGALEKAAPALQKLSLEAAKHIDFVIRQTSLTRELTEFQKRQDEELAGPKGPLAQAQALIASLEKQGLVLSANQTFWLQFNATLIASADAMEKLANESARAMTAGLIEGVEVPETVIPQGELDALGIPPPPPEVSLWGDLLDSVQQKMVNFSDFVQGTLIGSFHAMVGAVGDAVAAWALYGESIGKALKKALAGILAQIAGEAAIQALLHAAYAIGRAAFGDFAGAGKHAIAALKFGAVAVAAGLGARAIAGGAFSGASGSGSGGTNERQGGPEARSQAPQVQDIDRRAGTSTQVVELRFTEQLGDVIEAKFIDRYNGGGRLRNVILTDGKG